MHVLVFVVEVIQVYFVVFGFEICLFLFDFSCMRLCESFVCTLGFFMIILLDMVLYELDKCFGEGGVFFTYCFGGGDGGGGCERFGGGSGFVG